MRSGRGSALPNWSLVIITDVASTCSAGIPRTARAAETRSDESISPLAAIASLLRGVAWPRTESASASDASSSKVALNSVITSAAARRVAQQFLGGGDVPLAQRFDASDRTDQLTVRRLLGDRDQRIRRAAHRRDHDDRATIEATAHDLGEALDRRRVADRGPAELDDDHAASNAPCAASTSALRIDPPAAPRMVLCPSATSLTSRIGS